MSTKEKLLEKLRSYSKNFSYQETETLLKSFGCKIYQGKGSRVAFVYTGKKEYELHLHKPHPKPYLCKGQLEDLNNFVSDIKKDMEEKNEKGCK